MSAAPDPARVGLAVLAAFDRGRAEAHAAAALRAARLRDVVQLYAEQDQARGLPPRGRAGRIARRLRGLASERHVRRLIRTRT